MKQPAQNKYWLALKAHFPWKCFLSRSAMTCAKIFPIVSNMQSGQIECSRLVCHVFEIISVWPPSIGYGILRFSRLRWRPCNKWSNLANLAKFFATQLQTLIFEKNLWKLSLTFKNILNKCWEIVRLFVLFRFYEPQFLIIWQIYRKNCSENGKMLGKLKENFDSNIKKFE